MSSSVNVKVRVSNKAAREGAGFTDPATGFTISPGQEKPLGPRVGVLTRARLASGFLIRVEKVASGGVAAPAAPAAEEAPGGKRKGFFGKGR